MTELTRMKTVLVTGYAKAPHGNYMFEVCKTSGIVMEIDTETNMIVNAEFTFATELARDFLRRVIVNYNLAQGIDGLIQRIEDYYYTPSTPSVIMAVKAAHKRYLEKMRYSQAAT
ncbi:DUF3870 domain-containing protein [Fictibacillus sp. WQ 8-8]|uniref:DUF3870 domain-containing protein n=1 Tax=unclassified Fictibacillus TaxID=2644029 RepID=UPI0006A782BF|nr:MULTISPECIES: DUF3870 domain-containing protein [unclassified Fictibacillus]MCQ6264216.1 DUF3870 domain-containing protein [Fictibacillus sp. WQ 8-8]MED2974922.1 DUF3870 domain-containing protein [Fictibacillus sp. B-59209]SFD46228.1 protein of unknown function [Bacillus sp. OV194]